LQAHIHSSSFWKKEEERSITFWEKGEGVQEKKNIKERRGGDTQMKG
jgi:hypothetical protein